MNGVHLVNQVYVYKTSSSFLAYLFVDVVVERGRWIPSDVLLRSSVFDCIVAVTYQNT
jgi:hypothetical protein